MKRRTVHLYAVAALLAAACPAAPAAANGPPGSCEAVGPAITAAVQSRDIRKLADLYARVQDPALGCSGKTIACSGRAIARAFAEEAGRPVGGGGYPEGAKALLLRAKAFGAPWQLLARLGDVELAEARAAHDPERYTAASQDLQDAINEAAAEPACKGESVATADDIERLRRQAAEAGLLSARFVATPTRDGTCGGIFLTGERGLIGEEKTPVPIRFDYEQASMTAEGTEAAATMRDCIKEKNYHRVVLSGHTDRKGSDAYNMDLSSRRLATVSGFLKQGGFDGEIVLQPKGKREPFAVDDPGQHTQAEIDQLDRRVEIREGR